MREDTDSATCWMESVPDGWLFLIAEAPLTGWLIAVGAPAEVLLGQSRVIERQIDRCDGNGKEFPAYPRIASPLCGADWLACGTAAVAFDPICGDGTANAMREAILAAAVINAAKRGENAGQLLRHYEKRLLAGFQKHLALCLEFYRSGHGGPWWQRESESVERGLNWCMRKAEGFEPFRYRLNGFELEAVS